MKIYDRRLFTLKLLSNHEGSYLLNELLLDKIPFPKGQGLKKKA